jgi:two-component system response regulator NreC
LKSKIKISIVDDHNLIHHGLKLILSEKSELYDLIGSYNSGEDFFESLKNGLIPDIAFVDLQMPNGLNGIEVLKLIVQNYPEIKVLVMSVNTELYAVTSAIKNGALGFLSKQLSTDEVFDAIESIMSGNYLFNEFVNQELVEKSFNSNYKPELDIDNPLTPRENQVLKLIAQGLTYKEIANTLFVSKRTIESHKANIFKKQQLIRQPH